MDADLQDDPEEIKKLLAEDFELQIEFNELKRALDAKLFDCFNNDYDIQLINFTNFVKLLINLVHIKKTELRVR